MLVVAVVALTQQKGSKQDAAGSSPAASTGATSSATRPSTSASRSTGTSTSASRSARPSDTSGSSTSTGGAEKLPLVILNNTTTNGLATQAAERFRNGGWRVDDIGNLTDDILSTCVYYDPDVDGAKAAAAALRAQFPGIQRSTEKFDGLPSGPLVVVLTSDYTSG
ncbi:LytR cell envelope-related transcriptional attenuator [Jatrophihabitans endophyticus]|uniref:LytR cell envelope-related transcriptional attenuator n=1 Tax=Jatrophihabitans endophyticus TaxID=1206085 RepID=A0A1M5RBS6_9ACTN|nr:LytR cell envelope-related transcriptional attenuator [Jatrophihabitans endophyticus]